MLGQISGRQLVTNLIPIEIIDKGACVTKALQETEALQYTGIYLRSNLF